MARDGTVILKFFLNVSRREQKKRFMERLDMPDKNWKFSEADAKERQHWKDYMAAYEDAISRDREAVGSLVRHPADNKWFSRLVVAGRDHRGHGQPRPPLSRRGRRQEEGARGRPEAAALGVGRRGAPGAGARRA